MDNILWMPSAKDTYAEILEKLQLDAALKLDDQVEKLIYQLSSFTNLCSPSTKFPSFRKCIINKNIAMIYSTDQTTVYIIAFFYNRTAAPF